GVSNGSLYAAGGPEDYESIPASSDLISNGINLTAAPYTTYFVLVDGKKDTSTTFGRIEFRIYEKDPYGNVTPLENAAVVLGSRSVYSDSLGAANLLEPTGARSATIMKHGYKPAEIRFTLNGDTTLIIQMERKNYTVLFHVNDFYSGEPIRNARVIIAGDTTWSDSLGIAHLSVPFGNQEYFISEMDYFSESGTITVESDTTFSFSLKPSRAEVNFKLLKEANPVNNAQVTLNDSSILSNALGIATFKEFPTSVEYEYTINREGYEIIEGHFYLRTDTTLRIEMVFLETQVGNIASSGSSLVFWPNPATHTLFVKVPGSPVWGTLLLMDLSGRIISKEVFSSENRIEMNISALESGLYYISFSADDRLYTGYFVK
ncbi:MAG: T9SS type A sorting domain-containing protein, partial [Bacteroidales bacterium]|nr:T9SS type A sorting domain-containing protein [Bacteroidales bacterium]